MPHPKCPECGKELKPVKYPSNSYLNPDQFDSVRAGDYYCDSCKGDRGKSGYRYYWKKEVLCVQCLNPDHDGLCTCRVEWE